MQDMRIALVQMSSRVGEKSANLAKIERFAMEAAARKVDIVCFPELCICGYNAGDNSTPEPESLSGDSVRMLEKIGTRSGLTILAGLLERDVSGIVYNTQVICSPAGCIGHYRKTHVPTSEIGTWRHGGEFPVFNHPKARYGIEICYDSHFPEVSTILAERGAELLFFPHASSIAGETAAGKKKRWLRYVPARAYDNAVYVAICNQVGNNGAGRDFAGVTFVCNPLGEVIAEAQSSAEEELVIADLKASELSRARGEPEFFFRHFRRPELYSL